MSIVKYDMEMGPARGLKMELRRAIDAPGIVFSECAFYLVELLLARQFEDYWKASRHCGVTRFSESQWATARKDLEHALEGLLVATNSDHHPFSLLTPGLYCADAVLSDLHNDFEETRESLVRLTKRIIENCDSSISQTGEFFLLGI